MDSWQCSFSVYCILGSYKFSFFPDIPYRCQPVVLHIHHLASYLLFFFSSRIVQLLTSGQIGPRGILKQKDKQKMQLIVSLRDLHCTSSQSLYAHANCCHFHTPSLLFKFTSSHSALLCNFSLSSFSFPPFTTNSLLPMLHAIRSISVCCVTSRPFPRGTSLPFSACCPAFICLSACPLACLANFDFSHYAASSISHS